jgi:hypothetical protein
MLKSCRDVQPRYFNMFDLFGLAVLQVETKIVSCHTADSKPVKQEVNGTVILPPLVFPGHGHFTYISVHFAGFCASFGLQRPQNKKLTL